MRLAILTTTECNGACRHCSVRPWMKANPGYHMSMKEIMELIHYTQLSGYRFDDIRLVGGEPLMWYNLIDAAELLKTADIADSITVITNGLLLKEFIKLSITTLLEHVTSIKISEYEGNEAQIRYAKAHFDRIEVLPTRRRPVSPDHFITRTLPADCQCQGYGYSHGQVTICSPARSMGYLDTKGSPGAVDLEKDYLKRFENIHRENQPYCQACVGNRNIHRHIEFEENRVC